MDQTIHHNVLEISRTFAHHFNCKILFSFPTSTNGPNTSKHVVSGAADVRARALISPRAGVNASAWD